MIQCTSIGCTKASDFVIERSGAPINAPTGKLKEYRCITCLEQDQRMGTEMRVIGSLVNDEPS